MNEAETCRMLVRPKLNALQATADALKELQAGSAAELAALLPAVLTKAFAGDL